MDPDALFGQLNVEGQHDHLATEGTRPHGAPAAGALAALPSHDLSKIVSS